MMLRTLNIARFPYLNLLLSAVLIMTHFSTYAGVTAIPDVVQPGAQQPNLSEPSDIPSTEAEEVVDIPAVIERPLDIDEGERIIVNQFELINAEEMPELGILTVEVEALVESLRVERPEGFTVGRLQEVANKITTYYRSKGLALAQAVIPMQDVQNGIVKIEIYIGYLDRVIVEGNQVYDSEVLKAEFKDLINLPIIKKDIEAALLRLTDYPGLQVYGVFQPGQLIGTADIVLNVQDNERITSNFRIDNFGSQETGRVRGRVSLEWNSLFKGPDKLGFIAQQAFRPNESYFYYVNYERFLPLGLLFRSSYSKSNYDVGGSFANQEISGDTKDISLYLEKSIIRSRSENLSASIGFSHTDSQVKQFEFLDSTEKSSAINLSVQYDIVDDFDPISFLRSDNSAFQTRSINFFTLQLTQGLEDVFGSLGSTEEVDNLPFEEQPARIGGSGEVPTGDFSTLFAAFTRFQNLTNTQSILLRAEAQWSDDLLLSQYQYAIGGPNSVRAFSPAFQLVDQAGFMSLEYIIESPVFSDTVLFDDYTVSELLKFSVYYDVAVGKLNDPGFFDEVGWKSYQGVGLGTQFNLPGKFDSKLLVAWPLGVGETATIDTGNGRAPQIWLNFSISF